MSIGEKLTTIADNRPKLYAKGASDFGTHFDVTGTNLVTIDKVHPKEHDVEILTDAESVSVCGKNLISMSVFADYEIQEDGSYYAPKEKDRKEYSFELPAGTYTLSYKLKCSVGAGYRLALVDKNGKLYQQYLVSTGDYVSFKLTFTASTDIVSIKVEWGNESAIGCYIKDLQIEKGGTVTEFEAFKGGTYPVTDGKAIVKSVSPTMNIATPTSGASIEAKGYLDGQAVIDELTQAIVNVGGEI